MEKKKRQKRESRSGSSEERVALTSLQRRYLRGQVGICIVATLFMLVVTLVFAGGSFKSSANWSSHLANAAFVLLPGGLCAFVAWHAFQSWRDLRLGYALRAVDQLQHVIRRKGTSLYLSRIGRLQTPSNDIDLHVYVGEKDTGREVRVTYSPHSRVIWVLSSTS